MLLHYAAHAHRSRRNSRDEGRCTDYCQSVGRLTSATRAPVENVSYGWTDLTDPRQAGQLAALPSSATHYGIAPTWPKTRNKIKTRGHGVAGYSGAAASGGGGGGEGGKYVVRGMPLPDIGAETLLRVLHAINHRRESLGEEKRGRAMFWNVSGVGEGAHSRYPMAHSIVCWLPHLHLRAIGVSLARAEGIKSTWARNPIGKGSTVTTSAVKLPPIQPFAQTSIALHIHV